MRPSRILEQFILPYFKQDEDDFEKSEFPIYVDYSVSFDDVNKKRIMILQSNTYKPAMFLGDKELVRSGNCDIVVASESADEAYNVSNIIFNIMRKSRGIDGVIKVEPLSDIEPLGINSKRVYMFTCSYGIIKED